MECKRYFVKVGDREIEITPEVLEVIHEYIHRPMSLEELAAKLGLETWEDAYIFIKRIPGWLMWMPISLWRYHYKRCGFEYLPPTPPAETVERQEAPTAEAKGEASEAQA